MALDKDALSELLDALRAGGDIDVVRAGMQTAGGRWPSRRMSSARGRRALWGRRGMDASWGWGWTSMGARTTKAPP